MLKGREVLYKITMVSFLDKLHKNRDKPNFQEDLRNLVEEPIYSGSSLHNMVVIFPYRLLHVEIFPFSHCIIWSLDSVHV